MMLFLLIFLVTWVILHGVVFLLTRLFVPTIPIQTSKLQKTYDPYISTRWRTGEYDELEEEIPNTNTKITVKDNYYSASFDQLIEEFVALLAVPENIRDAKWKQNYSNMKKILNVMWLNWKDSSLEKGK